MMRGESLMVWDANSRPQREGNKSIRIFSPFAAPIFPFCPACRQGCAGRVAGLRCRPGRRARRRREAGAGGVDAGVAVILIRTQRKRLAHRHGWETGRLQWGSRGATGPGRRGMSKGQGGGTAEVGLGWAMPDCPVARGGAHVAPYGCRPALLTLPPGAA